LSLKHQSAARASYEILVIDNGSDDFEQLKSLVQKIYREDQKVKLVSEPTVGLSHARNRGVEESRGDYVVFIDDDAVANARLVEYYIRCIQDHKPDVIGGNVLPLFEVRPSKDIEGIYWPQWSLKHFGKTDRWLENGEYFIGTNIGASRQQLISRPFNPELGRKGVTLTGGEEWYLGEPCYRRRFVAGAYVLHKVPENRTNRHYLANRFLAILNQSKQRVNLPELFYEWLTITAKEFSLFFKRISFHASVKYKVWQKYKMN
jgi:glycosyltransferase involved in cell wall biosynthesis